MKAEEIYGAGGYRCKFFLQVIVVCILNWTWLKMLGTAVMNPFMLRKQPDKSQLTTEQHAKCYDEGITAFL